MTRPLWPDLTGKVTIVTGGGAGFGEGFARAFSARGSAVGIFEVDMDNAKRVAAEIEAAGGRALALKCDVADADAVESAVEAALKSFGGIDFLINNAARHLLKYAQPFQKLTRAEIRGLFDVNVIGIVNTTLACRASMAARGGGSIVNLSSTGGVDAASPYGVTKLAVRGLTTAFAKELGPEGTRVNAIAPGLTATPNALADIGAARFAEYAKNLQHLKRRGEVEDIVNAALYFCSPEASFVTGETLKVSGGHPLVA